jgi:hypothetical protein
MGRLPLQLMGRLPLGALVQRTFCKKSRSEFWRSFRLEMVRRERMDPVGSSRQFAVHSKLFGGRETFFTAADSFDINLVIDPTAFLTKERKWAAGAFPCLASFVKTKLPQPRWLSSTSAHNSDHLFESGKPAKDGSKPKLCRVGAGSNWYLALKCENEGCGTVLAVGGFYERHPKTRRPLSVKNELYIWSDLETASCKLPPRFNTAKLKLFSKCYHEWDPKMKKCYASGSCRGLARETFKTLLTEVKGGSQVQNELVLGKAGLASVYNIRDDCGKSSDVARLLKRTQRAQSRKVAA